MYTGWRNKMCMCEGVMPDFEIIPPLYRVINLAYMKLVSLEY